MALIGKGQRAAVCLRRAHFYFAATAGLIVSWPMSVRA